MMASSPWSSVVLQQISDTTAVTAMMSQARKEREGRSNDSSPQRPRKLRNARSSLMEILHLKPNPPLSRSKSGTIKGIVGNDDVRHTNVCHARSPSEGDKEILKTLRTDWIDCHRRQSLRKTSRGDSSPTNVGLMQRIFSLRRRRKSSAPDQPPDGASGDTRSRRSRLTQMEEHAAWCNNNNNAASPEVKVRHYRSMSLSPSVSSTPPLAMFGTEDEDICSSVPPSPKEGDTGEDDATSPDVSRRQISPEMEVEIEKLIKEKTRSSRYQQDSEKGPTVKCLPSKNRKTCLYQERRKADLARATGRMAVSNPGTLRKSPDLVSGQRSSSLQPLFRKRQPQTPTNEPHTDSGSAGQRVIVQTVQLSEIITWKPVGTETKKEDDERTQPQGVDSDRAHQTVGDSSQCDQDNSQDNSQKSDSNGDAQQTDTHTVDCHKQKEQDESESGSKPSENLSANVTKAAGSRELKQTAPHTDGSVRMAGPLHMFIQPRRNKTPNTVSLHTEGGEERTGGGKTSHTYTEKRTLLSQDGQQKSYHSVISDGDSPVEVTVTSQQVTWVHAQCMCTDVQDNRFSFASNDSGIQQDEAPSSGETTKGELPWPDEVTTSHVMLEQSHDQVPPKRERPKSCLSVPGATLPSLHRGSRCHPKERSTSDLGGRAVVLEALRQYHLTDRVSSTITLEENDERTLSALERCKMKGRRMSTPHPIKLRECRSPPSRKRTTYKVVQTLPRRSSAPELIERKVQYRWSSSWQGSTSAQAGDLAVRIRKCLSDGEKALPTLEDSNLDEMTPTVSSVRRCSGDILQGILARSSSQPTYADALWDHVTLDVEELGFTAGDVIEVLDNTGRDWWYGTVGDREGWFPATFVRICNNWDNTADEFAQRVKEGRIDSDTALRSYSANLLSKDQARANVVLEIIHAERDYVKHLHDVLEGYVEKACRRPEMFCDDTLNTIFGNIVELHDFSSTFLQDLESHIVDGMPHLSQLGECFLRHRRGFELYSEYCNNHPLACEQLRLLKQNKKYQQFFEACRLLQQMIEIPLEGFLLIPVQKICKYPLQLKELLRFTRPHHPDYYCLQRALVCMRRIAALINERKRKMESLQKLAEWQNGVNDWQGTDLIETSSELIHSGELMKVNSSGWSQDRVFFLFDHQMIYCKKDMLWRDLLVYKGRIDMDNCEVCPIMDGKDAMFNVQVKNAFKVFDLCRHKWYLLQCHTAIEKQQWLEALQLERQRVRSDAENGFNLPDFRSKVAFLHHRQQVCAAGGKLGKGDKRKSMETSTSFSQDMPLNLPGHSSLPRATSIPSPSKKSGFHPFGRRKGKR